MNTDDKKTLLTKLQALYNASALAPLTASDHKKLEQIGNDIYAYIDQSFAETAVAEVID